MLKPGDEAPAFELTDDAGATVRSEDLRGRWVVLFFYPADETPFCTQENCAFRDLHAAFEAAGAVVLGVSRDDARTHAAFRKRHKLPFRLLSDEPGETIGAYGAFGLFGHPKRITYVIDPDGVVADVYESQVRAKNHAHRALEVVDAAAVERATQ